MNGPKKTYDTVYLRHEASGECVDFARYTEYVKSLEGKIDPDTVNVHVLDAMLEMAAAAGDLIDLYKKQIVYGRTDLKHKVLAANIALRRANTRLDEAVFTDGVEGQCFFSLPTPVKELNLRLLHAAMGLFGEAAELLTAVRKQLQTGKLDTVNVTEELGDAGYYDAAAHDAIGVPKHITMGRNKAKLDVRFGGSGTFFEKVNNRNLEAERAALAGSD